MTQPTSIATVLQAISPAEAPSPNKSCNSSLTTTRTSPTSPAIIDLLTRWGDDPARLLREFNPGLQASYCRDLRKVFTGTAPKLGHLEQAYGRKTPAAWLAIQLADLAEWAGCRQKLRPEQLDELATMMLRDCGHWNMAEVMLFCQRFKRGQYGKFYGAVDPMVVMQAVHEFANERNIAVEQYRRQAETQAKAEQERAYELEVQRLRQRYAARVPGAGTDAAPIDFVQYRFLELDSLADDDLADLINRIRQGRESLPTDILEMRNRVAAAREAAERTETPQISHFKARR